VSPWRRRLESERLATRRPLVLIFGEDENDRKALRELMTALRPRLEGYVETRRQPLVLIKNARPSDLRDRAQSIADVVARERLVRNVLCVFAHEDCDAVEPAHEAVAQKIEQALAVAGCAAHAVAPAWEMEAWWFLWPAAVTACNPSWSVPARFRGTVVGRIVEAKEEFQRAPVAHRGSRGARRYRPSDSPLIAEKVRELGIARSPAAISRSYDSFVAKVEECCSTL
jgi:hypothetical protein